MNPNDSTDEDARRFDASRAAGFLESEFERGGCTSGVDSEVVDVVGSTSNAGGGGAVSRANVNQPRGEVSVPSGPVGGSAKNSGESSVAKECDAAPLMTAPLVTAPKQSAEVDSANNNGDSSSGDESDAETNKSGFGQKEDASGSGDSTDSDERHDLDFLEKQKGISSSFKKLSIN